MQSPYRSSWQNSSFWKMGVDKAVCQEYDSTNDDKEKAEMESSTCPERFRERMDGENPRRNGMKAAPEL